MKASSLDRKLTTKAKIILVHFISDNNMEIMLSKFDTVLLFFEHFIQHLYLLHSTDNIPKKFLTEDEKERLASDLECNLCGR